MEFVDGPPPDRPELRRVRLTAQGDYQRRVGSPITPAKAAPLELFLHSGFGDVDATGGDSADEDRIGSASTREEIIAFGGIDVGEFRRVLAHTDTDFDEEVYHKVKFRVTSGQVTGGWSTLEFSPVSTIGW
ncbi:MAG: hypothetical protein L0H79_05450 [Intrasporangium sp.]|uniref:hypothetical protein n=1 Tax=Intrasporangium sp. TaxID=1925024 RepID=UPI002649FF99|nr:hypothetical protein [Intrasporangium sp.]MDN5795182.1 hypothetical protein [Intrasporangium sp.]